MSGMKSSEFKFNRFFTSLLVAAFTLAGCGQESVEFDCEFPDVFADSGDGCECRTDSGFRTMGNDGQLCVPYSDIMSFNEQDIGGAGYYFVHLERSLQTLVTDTLFFGEFIVEDPNKPGEFIFTLNPVFGQLGFYDPSVESWSDECLRTMFNTSNISESLASGFLVDPPETAEIKAGTELEVSWNRLDVDQDCRAEFIRAVFTMDSPQTGQGDLLVFGFTEDSPNNRVLIDEIGIRLERIPTDW